MQTPTFRSLHPEPCTLITPAFYNMVYTAPKSILVVGSGVFGLSTALALCHRPAFSNTHITLIDKHPFPNPTSSSIDSSRIIRADYKDSLYAALAAEAQIFWRGHDDPSSPFGGQLGSDGRYHESGLVLVGDDSEYIQKSMMNVTALFGPEKVRHLPDAVAIKAACSTGGGMGKSGYVNYASGWADAEAGMRFLRAAVEGTGRVVFVVGEVVGLVEMGRVCGVKLRSGHVMRAELTVVAAGAWTPGIVDLSGRAVATGQVMGYIELTEEEQSRYGGMPVILSFTTGLFVLPPRNRVLKVARHAVGYINTKARVSVPVTDQGIPKEGEGDLRRAVGEMVPEFRDRPFVRTRMCWYTDTPTGDFIVCYHPTRKGLFLATGGSGHGYKFLPVLGGEVVDILEGVEGARFADKWAWKDEVVAVVTADGSRGGMGQVELEEALRSF